MKRYTRHSPVENILYSLWGAVAACAHRGPYHTNLAVVRRCRDSVRALRIVQSSHESWFPTLSRELS